MVKIWTILMTYWTCLELDIKILREMIEDTKSLIARKMSLMEAKVGGF